MNTSAMSITLAETIMMRYPDLESYPYMPWCYPHGYMLMGFARLWEATGDSRYFEYIQGYCDRHVSSDGSVRGFDGNSMDNIMPGAILVWMYEQTGLKKYELACRRIRAAFDDYPRTREGGFLHCRHEHPGEMWIDGVFMGQMFECRYGRAFQEDTCFTETIRQLTLIYRYCHDADGLLRHAYSEDPSTPWADAEGRSSAVWSEGLGWYALMLVEALALIPRGFVGRSAIEDQLYQLLSDLKKHQDPATGLWFQVVNQGDEPRNWCDTSGSSMFLYCVLEAIRLGIAKEQDYQPVAERAYRGLLARAVPSSDGGIDILNACDGVCVQLSQDAYLNYEQVTNAKEAVCGYLWAMIRYELSAQC